MKHRIVHALQKYVLNPPIKLVFAVGLAAPGYTLLETMGRKSGRPPRTPVGNGCIGGQFWIVAEHGMKAGYILNIERSPRVPQQKLNLLQLASRCVAEPSTGPS
jgi:F420H(2)-dependent quinone reductase